MAPQGKPWDLMAWGFSRKARERCFVTKSAPQLQPAAAALQPRTVDGELLAHFHRRRFVTQSCNKDFHLFGWFAVRSFCCSALYSRSIKKSALTVFCLLLGNIWLDSRFSFF